MSKIKTIPFDVEIAKSNQESNITTNKGNQVRIICWDVQGYLPIAALVKDENDIEHLVLCDSDGAICEGDYACDNLILHVLEDDEQFKVGDVLALKSGGVFILDKFEQDKNKFLAFLKNGNLTLSNPIYYCGNKSDIKGYATKEEQRELAAALLKKNTLFSDLMLRLFLSEIT